MQREKWWHQQHIRTALTTLQDKDLKKWKHLLLQHAIVCPWFLKTCLNDVVLAFKVDILATFQRLRAECLAVYAEIAMVVALTSLGSGASRSTEEDTLSQVGGKGWMKVAS